MTEALASDGGWRGAVTVPGKATCFQRVMLTADGTVLRILQAFAEEPIDTVKLGQHFDGAGPADAGVQVSPGTQILRRRVLLQGRHSGRNLVHAEAVVVAERVGAAFTEALLQTDAAIGSLLTRYRMETFREILATGSEPAGPRCRHFGIGPSAPVIFRTYRIFWENRPIIMITERFPADSFLDVAV